MQPTVGAARLRGRRHRRYPWQGKATIAAVVGVVAFLGSEPYAVTHLVQQHPGSDSQGWSGSLGADGNNPLPPGIPLPPASTQVPGTTTTPPGLSLPGIGTPTGSAAGIPATVLAAYQRAAASEALSDPGCHLQWQLLAAIGQVESGQAEGGDVSPNGTVLRPILGPVLDGNGFAPIPDTDGGRYDHDTRWDRAVGPMQFIPSTWAHWGVDGNGDGVVDPENVFDATLAAAHYLCANHRDLATATGLDAAIRAYNNSDAYLATVRSWYTFYLSGTVATLPDLPGNSTPVIPPNLANPGGGPPADNPGNGGHGGAPATAPTTPAPGQAVPTTPAPPTTAGPTTTPPGPGGSTTPPGGIFTVPPTGTGSPTPTGSGTPTPTCTPTTSTSPTPSGSTTPSPTPTTASPTPSPSGSPTAGPCATTTPTPTGTPTTGTPAPATPGPLPSPTTDPAAREH